jgi:hypothetical protein
MLQTHLALINNFSSEMSKGVSLRSAASAAFSKTIPIHSRYVTGSGEFKSFFPTDKTADSKREGRAPKNKKKPTRKP